MAGVGFTAQSGSVALTASTAKTIVQLVAATNTRALIRKIDVSSDGITPTDPGIQIDILVQSSAGTMSALTPIKLCSSDSETLQTTAQKTATGEPTAGNILWTGFYNEQSWIPLYLDPPIPVVGGTRIGIRATPGTLTATTHIGVTATCEE